MILSEIQDVLYPFLITNNIQTPHSHPHHFQFLAGPVLRMVHSQTMRQGLFNLRFNIHHQMIAVQKAQVPEKTQTVVNE